MLDNLRKAIRKPGKAMRYIRFFLEHLFRKRKGTLVFIGAESGGMFSLMHRGFEKSYVFEANPHRYECLQRRFGNDPHIELHHVTVADHDGEIQFQISNNNNGTNSYKRKNKKMKKNINELIAELLAAIAQEVQSEETPKAQDKIIIKGTGLSYEELIQKPNAQEILINLHNRMVDNLEELERRIEDLENNDI